MTTTIDNFRENLRIISEESGTSAIVYALLKNNQLKKLDIENTALDGIRDLFLEYISNEIILDEGKHLLALSDADERGNTIYEYDLEIPENFKCIEQAEDTDVEKPKFDIKTDGLSNIDALIIIIGDSKNYITLYKTIAPLSILRKKSFMIGAIKTNRLEKIDKDILKISQNFQFIKTKLGFFVIELKTLERLFSFHSIIKKEATKSCLAIENMSILENPETLTELTEDIKFARKLVNIHKTSPVLKCKIPNTKIIEFCDKYPLKGKIRFNEDKTKILLDTKASKNLFIKILMDDYLASELTELHYDSLAKNNIEPDKETK